MSGFLETILASRRLRVREAMAAEAPERLAETLGRRNRPPDPAPALRSGPGLLIGEIKRASPSKGPIAEVPDPAARARLYERGGAGAISVLCEPDFFRGGREDLRAASAAVKVPVLCKDFVVDPYQLLTAAADGAAWVLLIARVLGDDLPRFVERSLDLGLEPLVEVHGEDEMAAAAASGARLIGANARDLATFGVDLSLVARLAGLCPPSCAFVAESGIGAPEDLPPLRRAGAHGFLIGEALMRSGDPEGLLRAFGRSLHGDRP